MLGPLSRLATSSPALVLFAVALGAFAFVVPVLFSLRGTRPEDRAQIIRAWAAFRKRR